MTDTLKITGDNITITDASGNVVYYPPPDPTPPDPTPPTDKPVLRITTMGGTANTTTPVTIEGTIDVANVACDILLDAGPTSFGTTKANASGLWTKTVTLNAVGTWTLTAHATNAAGKTDSNSVVFQVSQGGSGGGGGGGTGTPPEPSTRITAGSTLSAIQTAITNCAVGGSVVLAAGSYNLGGSIRLKSGVVLWADGVAILNGGGIDGSSLSGWTVAGKAPGQGFAMTSPVNATGASSFVVANVTFNNLPSNGYDGSAVRLGSARSGTIVNCDFSNCQGNNLGMYNMDTINVDGCHFMNCRQPISFQFATDYSNGNNITVQRCTFEGTTRAAMEMGPDSNKHQAMNNLKVNNNWFDDFNNAGGGDAWAMLPISLVAQAAKNTEVKGNYISLGTRPTSMGINAPAIEFTGSGECTGNTIDGFKWSGFAYQSGWNIHDNPWWNAPWGWTNNGSGTGTFANNNQLGAKPVKPPKPTRIDSSTYYPWSH